MKQKEYYQSIIQVDGGVTLKVNSTEQYVYIHKNEILVSTFAFNRKIYTLFKEIQDIVKSNQYLIIDGNMGNLYSGEIILNESIYMQVTNEHGCLTLDFYTKDEANQKQLLYLMPLTYTVKTLFQNMLIPYRLQVDPNYRLMHVFQFLDMMVILNDHSKNQQNEVKG